MIGMRNNRSGLTTPSPLSDEGARRRLECAADEARWAAKLRATAKTKAREPAPGAAPVTILLDVVDGMTRYDNLIMPRALPIAVGCEGEDLACGKCGDVIASRAGRDTVRRNYPQGDRVVIRCTCRALNVLCGDAGRKNRQYFRQRLPLSRRIRA
jgi:hypothetical protein